MFKVLQIRNLITQGDFFLNEQDNLYYLEESVIEEEKYVGLQWNLEELLKNPKNIIFKIKDSNVKKYTVGERYSVPSLTKNNLLTIRYFKKRNKGKYVSVGFDELIGEFSITLIENEEKDLPNNLIPNINYEEEIILTKRNLINLIS